MFVPNWKVFLLLGIAATTFACGSDDSAVEEENVESTKSELLWLLPAPNPVGLSLWFEDGEVRYRNGTKKTVDLYENYPRYIDELDITATIVTATDQGIEPLKHSGDMASLDWRGVQQVDEDWRPEAMTDPPTYTRSRFYRNAKWMNRNSTFLLTPVDDRDRVVGVPILTIGGEDDKWRNSDDAFIRRFDARQVTPGCRAIGDCSNATTFIAQGLMQIRDAMHGAQRAEYIPAATKKLKLFWSEQPLRTRSVDVRRRSFNTTQYRYGFVPKLETLTTPANGQYFQPGEGVDFRVTYRDGAGNLLHPENSLHAYADFATDQIESGLGYYDGLRQLLTLYYALKHREGLMIWNLAGPTNKLKYSDKVVTDFEFLTMDQIPTATVAQNGFSAKFAMVPPPPFMIFTPEVAVSNVIHVDIPEDALPGTYVMNIKGRREWGGQSLAKAAHIELQVGQTATTTFTPKTGNCNSCHSGPSGLDNILHGTNDRRSCFGCHAPLASEPDNALDYRIHLIHTRSRRVPGNPNQCSMCHLTPPTGPARGFPGIGPF